MTAVQVCRHGRMLLQGCQSCLGPDDWTVVDHAALDAEWRAAFDALRAAGLEHDADDPIAVRYRAASVAVNHANRSREVRS